ncbi:Nuclear export mediator factor NEMF [Zea mays]|uniref:Nuclear export mediator factor NEMF n=1 Tax=Zea mays TaxID=4577 RepID=A0A3L6FES9_MAIZE|nr:Nuclear export mediator factor NEMF [Zea mays]
MSRSISSAEVDRFAGGAGSPPSSSSSAQSPVGSTPAISQKLPVDVKGMMFSIIQIAVASIAVGLLLNSDKSTTPSGFNLKLRKHIHNKRLEDVHMLRYDRIMLFHFGFGSNAHFIILDLYAQRNILLMDLEYTVMTLRSHRLLPD